MAEIGRLRHRVWHYPLASAQIHQKMLPAANHTPAPAPQASDVAELLPAPRQLLSEQPHDIHCQALPLQSVAVVGEPFGIEFVVVDPDGRPQAQVAVTATVSRRARELRQHLAAWRRCL